MSEAKRYVFNDYDPKKGFCTAQSYVLHSDHEACVADLTARIASLEREKEEARDEIEVLTDCLNGSSKAKYTAEMYDAAVSEAREKALEDACGVLKWEANRMIAKYGATTKAGTIGEVAMLLRALSLTIRAMKGAKP